MVSCDTSVIQWRISRQHAIREEEYSARRVIIRQHENIDRSAECYDYLQYNNN